jgi:hypothetical protein
MLMNNNATVRNYWLVLAAMYGLTLSVVAMADWPWPLYMGGAFILFAVLHGIRYRQVGRKVQGKLATASPWALDSVEPGAKASGPLISHRTRRLLPCRA